MKTKIKKLAKSEVEISFNKQQYEELIHSLEIAETVYALLRDMVDREKYDERLAKKENLNKHVLNFIDQYGLQHITEEYEGEKYTNEKYVDVLLDDLHEYEDYAFWEGLVERLAQKEFIKTYSETEIKKMSLEERYLKQADIEDKYWKEFEEHGLDRVMFIL